MNDARRNLIRRLVLVLATGTLSSVAMAQYYLYTPEGVSNPPPAYYSGTDSFVSFKVEGEGEDFAEVDLYLNGELVRQLVIEPHGAAFEELGISATFDSTHFPNGTVVTPTVVVHDRNGPTTTYSAPGVAVENTAIVYGRNEWEDLFFTSNSQGAVATSEQLPSLNIGADVFNISKGWSSFDFYTDLIDSTASVVYINTHGDTAFTVSQPPAPQDKAPSTWLLSDYDEVQAQGATRQESNYIVGTQDGGFIGSVLKSRQAAMGSGDPPYNSGGVPPIWFAWNDACLAANDNAFAEGYLWPYTNHYDNNFCEDQAQMGWSVLTPVGMSRPGAETVWPWFQAGHTADEARLQLYARYVQYKAAQGVTVPSDDNSARSTVHVYGDFYARLHGVYTGGPGAVTAWHD